MQQFELNSNLLHELVNFSTYNTVLDNVFDDSDFENELFTEDTFYVYMFDFDKYKDAISESIKVLMPEYIILADNLSIKVSVGDVYSPKFYNFAKDEVDLSIEVDTERLFDIVSSHKHYSDFYTYLNTHYRSYDGFVSFMPHNFELWADESDMGLKVSAAINYLLSIQSYFERVDSYAIYYDIRDSCNLFDFISDSAQELYDNEYKQLKAEVTKNFRERRDFEFHESDYTLFDNTSYIEQFVKYTWNELSELGQYKLGFK